jgi:hypothetical protein
LIDYQVWNYLSTQAGFVVYCLVIVD